jgi:hypothetical protein
MISILGIWVGEAISGGQSPFEVRYIFFRMMSG